ncbi:MAG: TonB-dependent receptor [Gammaproteobacteria bacterium]
MSFRTRIPSVVTTARVASAVALLAATTLAQAQSTPVLEEIVVTATKRIERLQDVPISVSAITTDDMKERGYFQYADYLNSVPGVYFQDQGPGKGVIRIRGISGVEGGVPSTTATYFGESVTSVLTNQGGKPNLRLVDIDRVEVLRGPQGTLFGADALAGVVRIIPAAPNFEGFDANVGLRGFTTAHSSDTSYHVEGMVNVPLVTDKLAARVVVYRDQIAGYIDNTFKGQEAVDYSGPLGQALGVPLPPGTLVSPAIAPFTRHDIDSEDTWGVRAALRWNATDRLTIDLSHATQDVQLNGEPFVQPAAGDYELSRGLDAYRHGGYGERLNLTSLVGTYGWERVSLTAISSWMDLKRYANQDLTSLAAASFGAPVPWLLEDRSDGHLFTQEVRLQSVGESKLQWLLGAFYLSQHFNAGQLVDDFSCPACAPTVLAGQDFAFKVGPSRLGEQEQRSVFGQASYELAKAWTLGVGARYLESDIESPFPVLEGILAGGAPTPPTAKGSDDEFNPSAYLRFEPTANVTTYLQAGRGFRGGQANQALPDNCLAEAQSLGVKPITDADTLVNYELGVKSRHAGGRLTINAAVYRDKWSGVQLLSTLQCQFSVILNGGDVKGRGAELEVVAEPTDAWRMNLSLSYNHNEFESVDPTTGYVVGQRLPDAPHFNGSLGVQRGFHLGGQWNGFVRGDYNYVSGVVTQFGPLDAFDTANVRVSFQRDNLALELFGRNILDERGTTYQQLVAGGLNQTLVRPREIGVEVRYGFK